MNLIQMETGRLLLRHWTESDASDLFKYASDRRVSEMALWPQHTSVEMSRDIIKQFFIPNHDNFAMTLKDTGEVIGCIGLVPSGEEHHAPLENEREVGYWIGRPHWGKGLTSEALSAILSYCRNSLKLKSLLLTTDLRNRASQRVAEKCGFKLIDNYIYNGHETLIYRIELN